jgi:hypothetical protein
MGMGDRRKGRFVEGIADGWNAWNGSWCGLWKSRTSVRIEDRIRVDAAGRRARAIDRGVSEAREWPLALHS